jgi:autotransporter translocation and assembly factor TamB
MFSVHNNDINTVFRNFFAATQGESLEDTQELQVLSDSDDERYNSGRNSVMSNREELLISQNIALKNEVDDFRLQMETLKFEMENLKKEKQALAEQLEYEKSMKQAEKQKSAALQHQVEAQSQAREKAEKEVLEERQGKTRELAGRLEAQQLHAATNANYQTMLVQMNTNLNTLLQNLSGEQARHKADNEFWQKQDALLRKHIHGSISQCI